MAAPPCHMIISCPHMQQPYHMRVHAAPYQPLTSPACAPLPPPPRALQPGTHYLDFWKDSKDDIFDLVPRLNAQWAANRTRFVDIATRAQGFAAKLLTIKARLQYWQRALQEYTALMPDMPQLVQQLVEQLAAAGKLRGGARGHQRGSRGRSRTMAHTAR